MQLLEKLRGIRRDDWIALGVTLFLHGGLLGVFALINISASAPPSLGYVEVELGTLAEGQPVQQAPKEEAPPAPAVPTSEEPEETLEAEEITTQPIDLPDAEAQDPDKVQESNPDEPAAEQSDSESIPPAGGGAETGRSGETSGESGEGTDKEKSAPFQIEGLDRVTLTAPMPRYAANVNATIRVRITVDPEGRVIRRIPLIKGNPRLEQAVMEALNRWRFNALPDNAPEQNQTGTITFRFRLE